MFLEIGNIIKIEYDFTHRHHKYTELVVGEIIDIIEVLDEKPTIIKIEQIVNYEEFIKKGVKSNIFREYRVSEITYGLF